MQQNYINVNGTKGKNEINNLPENTSRTYPDRIWDSEFMFPAFFNGKALVGKKRRLPAMGWNSWNAFGSQNNEETSIAMADALIELGLADLGYQYIVLDDGCYKDERIDGKLSNHDQRFPSGFKKLSDEIHSRGLKFGMYNDIGTNLCAGAAVGTCGYEKIDAENYLDWGIDFIKVDNCYYLWDNATFSNSENVKYTYAPKIRSITVKNDTFERKYNAVKEGLLLGNGAQKNSDDFVNFIGTFDGTGVGVTPVGACSSELAFGIEVQETGNYEVIVEYRAGVEVGSGSWLQLAVGNIENEKRYFDDMLSVNSTWKNGAYNSDDNEFTYSEPVNVELSAGKNVIRLMNHRRQENTLHSYAVLRNNLEKGDRDIVFSICEWGKTQPQNWGYKTGDSWRILNDITFQVGSLTQIGSARWSAEYTDSITSQYNKAVILDEFAGLERGWNDPDMLVIGMDGITDEMGRTHMTMWCMMNSPLMLGMDLRKVKIGDEVWNTIANKAVIALNQDELGVQAKRIYSSIEKENPDKEYITNNDRVDILAKPLSNGDIALSFINLSDKENGERHEVTSKHITKYLSEKMVNAEIFENASKYCIMDIWTGEKYENIDDIFGVQGISAYGNRTIRISPIG